MSQVMHESTEDGAVLFQRGRSSWLRWKRRSPESIGSVEGVLIYRTLMSFTCLFGNRTDLLTVRRDPQGLKRVHSLLFRAGMKAAQDALQEAQADAARKAAERAKEDEALRRLFRNSGLTPPDGAHD